MVYGKVNFKGYEFDGPYNSTTSLQNRPGVYVITGRNRSDEDHKVLDVGISEDVRTRIVTHDRKSSWNDQRFWYVGCAVHYTDLNLGREIERDLRSHYNPPCGLR